MFHGQFLGLMKIEMSDAGRVEDLLSADAYRAKVS